MKYLNVLIGTALSAYILTPTAAITQKVSKDNRLAVTLAHKADHHGNNNGQLELTEIQDAYERMGINPESLTMNPYQRLVTSGDPTATDKPKDFRFPTQSDLERGIHSYR